MSGASRIASLALLAAGCGSGPVAAAVSLSPSELGLVQGETAQLAATAVDEEGRPIAVTWKSSTPGTATVSASGLVTGVSPGQSVITASAGQKSAFARATVRAGGVVGAAGGRLTALDGTVSLEIPPGAVAGPTGFGVERVARPPLDPRLVDGSAVQVSPAAPLLLPVSLEIIYDPKGGPIGLPPGALRLARVDGAAWREVAGSDDDGRRARGAIDAGGIYGVRQAEAQAACTAPEDRQFDFWLGEWSIRGANGGGGQSSNTRDAAGCVILEHFSDRDVVGLSVSFRAAGTWYQTYVDNQGTRLLLSGGLVDDKMVLTTAAARSMDRITWEVVSSAVVHQLGEHSDNGGASWTVAFEGTYTRR